jgi:Fuc2NAc and GlcNAc transferase
VTPGLAFLRPAGFAPGVALAAVFVVATANVYNFMDGINGIAAISGLVAFALLAVSGWLRGEPSSWVLLAAVLAASCAGFLPFNFPRARVFMGDVGSVLLGFAFALFAVAWSRDLADLVMFGLFLFPFYADELVSLPPRLRSGDSLTRPHRRHVYQILVNQMARPHWQIAILYAIVQAAVALTAIAIRPLGWAAEASWLGLALAAAWMAATRVRRREN